MRLTKRGAVPIPYIIALVLGIMVIALIGYWLFFSGGEFMGIITEKACEAKKMAYCSDWKIQGAKPAPGKFSAGCTATESDRSAYYAPECCRFGWAASDLIEADCGIES